MDDVGTKPESKKEPLKDAENAMPGYGGGGGVPIIAGRQNRAVQLVGVRFSDGRQRDLRAKFAEIVPWQGMGPGDPRPKREGSSNWKFADPAGRLGTKQQPT